MQDIEKWMQDFSKYWKSYDLEKVLSLFTEDVEYYESPYEKFLNFEELSGAWEYIKTQKDIIFEYIVFSKEDEKYTIDWYLEYENSFCERSTWSGIYILKLNSENKCYFFKQVGEEKIK